MICFLLRNGEQKTEKNVVESEDIMETFNKSITEIIPYLANPKSHDDKQISNVAESIKQFGFVQPIVIDKNNEIVIGHCRYEASKRLGLKEVPCVLVDNLTDEQVRKLRIIDNKTNESEWDLEALSLETEDLDFDDFDIDFGFLDEEQTPVENQTGGGTTEFHPRSSYE